MKRILLFIGFALIGISFLASFILFVILVREKIDLKDPRNIPKKHDGSLLFIGFTGMVGMLSLFYSLHFHE